ATSVLAVLGVFPQGPVNEAFLVTSWNQFAMQFGGSDPNLPFGTQPSMAPYALWQFFNGGGSTAWVVGLDGVSSVGSLGSAVLAQVGDPVSSSAPAPALDQIGPGRFNIMCIPDLAFTSTAEQASVIAAAHRFCKARQAFLIVDPPPPAAAMTSAWLPGANAMPVDNIGTPQGMQALQDWANQFVNPNSDAAAAYYPWVQIADPWNNFASRSVPPSGAVAGVYASTDEVGVWKAPAGLTATLSGVTGLADVTMTDTVNSTLNAQGINCLRTFPGYGNVVWGARTLAGASDTSYTYVSTRRLADFIQQSLQQAFKWTVFEPNGPLLWSSLSVTTAAFMTALWKQGALQGASPTTAFKITCDATTTSVADIQAGIVNLNVAFAPVEPAEFIVLNIPLGAGHPAGS
ncbi:MAG TPA: phage tail sheath C-terminal domain-containing protein, partial [Solirubrobacteraceae bacterium]|nr:phage tail sheath C-terminal domain-containing protein [Solirubrobacteraceae bacterium]